MNKELWKESIDYQVYPRSFNDFNVDGIGDIKGIVEKLDYSKELGRDIICLSPVYKSPNDDNGYDISDYENIMDDLGIMEDIDEIIKEGSKGDVKLDQQPDKGKWDLKPLELLDLKKALSKWQVGLEKTGLGSLLWNNNDLPRIFSRWGNDKEYRVESAKMLATLLYGMKGAPYIYQGEDPWIGGNPNYKEINSESQLNDENSIFNYCKKLNKIRKSNPVFVHGEYKLILEENKEIFAYTRTLENEKILVICNFTENKTKFVLEEQMEFKYREILISNYYVNVNESIDDIEFRPYECRVHKFVL